MPPRSRTCSLGRCWESGSTGGQATRYRRQAASLCRPLLPPSHTHMHAQPVTPKRACTHTPSHQNVAPLPQAGARAGQRHAFLPGDDWLRCGNSFCAYLLYDAGRYTVSEQRKLAPCVAQNAFGATLLSAVRRRLPALATPQPPHKAPKGGFIS